MVYVCWESAVSQRIVSTVFNIFSITMYISRHVQERIWLSLDNMSELVHWAWPTRSCRYFVILHDNSVFIICYRGSTVLLANCGCKQKKQKFLLCRLSLKCLVLHVAGISSGSFAGPAEVATTFHSWAWWGGCVYNHHTYIDGGQECLHTVKAAKVNPELSTVVCLAIE